MALFISQWELNPYCTRAKKKKKKAETLRVKSKVKEIKHDSEKGGGEEY